MYKKLSHINSWKSAAENQFSATLVLISGSETGNSRTKQFSRKQSRTALWRFVVRVLSLMAAAWAWAFSARLIRSTGPGLQGLERHEFESVEMRQGGFGGPF